MAYSRKYRQRTPADQRKKKSLATRFPEIAAQWHPTKNGTLLPIQIGSGVSRKVWWKCPAGPDHEWESSISQRTCGRKTGCPFCAKHGPKQVSVSNCLATVRPDLSSQWHPTKNGDLTPRDVIAGGLKRIFWICERGHEWAAPIKTRCDGHGCPHCALHTRESAGEREISTFLTEIGVDFAREVTIKECRLRNPLPFDFVVANSTFTDFGVIEFHGRQHFEPVKWGTRRNHIQEFARRLVADRMKREFCKRFDIPMLEIRYDEPGIIECVDRFIGELEARR